MSGHCTCGIIGAGKQVYGTGQQDHVGFYLLCPHKQPETHNHVCSLLYWQALTAHLQHLASVLVPQSAAALRHGARMVATAEELDAAATTAWFNALCCRPGTACTVCYDARQCMEGRALPPDSQECDQHSSKARAANAHTAVGDLTAEEAAAVTAGAYQPQV